VRATRRGRDVYPVARKAIAEIEGHWAEQLGERRMQQLRRLLTELNAALTVEP
jgi:hypothetical protein